MAKIVEREFIDLILKGERDFSSQDLSELCLSYRGPFGEQKIRHKRCIEVYDYLRTVKEPFNFNGANLSRALLQGIVFLGGIYAVSANLTKTDLQGSQLPQSIFMAANLEEAQFRGSHLEYSNFSGANLKDAVLKGCRLDNSIFDYANLTDADFKESQIRGCMFRGAEMKGARMASAKFDSGTVFYGAKNLDISDAHDLYAYNLIRDASELEPRQALEALQMLEPNIRTKRERESFGYVLKEVKGKL